MERIESDSPDVTVTKDESADQGVLTYRVSQLVARPGDQKSAIRFVVRKPGGVLEPSSVMVHYHGQRTGEGRR